jgi:polyvinyl alcohol dehydrogenase (cytochrome)
MWKSKLLAGAAALAGLVLSGTAIAQDSDAGSAPRGGRGPAPAAKPGYALPPENAGGRYAGNGEPDFKARCAGCHDPAVDRAPSRAQLEGRSAEDVYDAIKDGKMAPMAAGLNESQLYAIAYYLTHKAPVPRSTAPDSNPCPTQTPLDVKAAAWNGWGNDPANSRYQPNPGLKTTDVPKLKVKWSFSYPGTKNAQATVFGGRVFVASMAGKIYSLDAKTGCVFWRTDQRAGVRATMTVGPLASAPSHYALYLGDDRMFVRALDAMSGKELWATRIGDHVSGRISGAPTLYNGVVYAALASGEENLMTTSNYKCCTFRGAVAAVDAKTGKILWRREVIAPPLKPTGLNRFGQQMYGPAGAGIWSAPTIDIKRGQVLVGTGNSYTEVEEPASDAIVALDIKTGAIRWTSQVLAHDNATGGCHQGASCPPAPDFDFGSSPHVITVGGKDLIVTGNKSAIAYGMDPTDGHIVWQTPKLGSGGALGGFEFGTATDGKVVYGGLADGGGPTAKPSLLALNPANGAVLWRVDGEKVATCNIPSGRCAAGYSAGVSVIPGVVFAGDMNGWLRAFDAANGHELWKYETTLPLNTANGVKGVVGGSIDNAGPTIAGGMVYVHSGYNGNAGGSNVLIAFSPDGK